MIAYGFEDPKWMAQTIIRQSDPRYLKVAVIELMSAAWKSDTPCFPVEEMFDRLVQVATTGAYYPSEIASNIVYDAVDQVDDVLSEEDEKTLEQFKRELGEYLGDRDDSSGEGDDD